MLHFVTNFGPDKLQVYEKTLEALDSAECFEGRASLHIVKKAYDAYGVELGNTYALWVLFEPKEQSSKLKQDVASLRGKLESLYEKRLEALKHKMKEGGVSGKQCQAYQEEMRMLEESINIKTISSSLGCNPRFDVDLSAFWKEFDVQKSFFEKGLYGPASQFKP